MNQRRTSTDNPPLEEIRRQYEAIRATLTESPAEDFVHQLPNLVEEIRTISRTNDDILRFQIGISFSRNQTLLDYHLSRVVATENGTRVQETKSPVSQNHRYLQFTYPPDPEATADGLRGAVLAILDQELLEIRQAQAQAESKESIADLWQILSDS